MDSQSISFVAFESNADQRGPSQRADLPVLHEVLTPSDPPEFVAGSQVAAPRGAWPDDDVDINLAWAAQRAGAVGWTCATGFARTQLESVIRGVPAPLRSPSLRIKHLKLVPQASAIEAPSAAAPPDVFMPAARARIAAAADIEAETGTGSAASSVTAVLAVLPPTPVTAIRARAHARAVDRSARTAQVARSMLVKQKQEFDRLDAGRARQIEQLTHRAELAEGKVRTLEEHIAAEQRLVSALGRRFGQKPHEMFPAFVARLGMTAKSAAKRREPIRT